jgi:hypothetical protein
MTELLIHPRDRKVREYYPQQNGNVYVERAQHRDSRSIPCPVHVYTLVMWGAAVAAAQAGYHGGD